MPSTNAEPKRDPYGSRFLVSSNAERVARFASRPSGGAYLHRYARSDTAQDAENALF